jgi:polar amino acid transport system substrate-binding protein
METIVRLVADPYPPYQYEESGTVKGVDHDVIVEAFRASGYEARTLLLSWDRCMKSMEEGSVDGVYQIVKTPERERRFLFSDPLRTAKTSFYGLRHTGFESRGPSVSSPLDFERRSIGVLAGYSYNPAVDGLKPPNKIEVGSHELLVQELRSGRFELALMDQGVAEYLISKHRITDIVRIGGYTIERDLAVAFRKKRADLAEAFNSGLNRMRLTSTYRSIFANYGLTATPTSRSS